MAETKKEEAERLWSEWQKFSRTLQGGDLNEENLSEANLTEANLEGADLEGAKGLSLDK